MILDTHIEQNMEINLLMMKINPEILKFAKVLFFRPLPLIYAFIFKINLVLNTQLHLSFMIYCNCFILFHIKEIFKIDYQILKHQTIC